LQLWGVELRLLRSTSNDFWDPNLHSHLAETERCASVLRVFFELLTKHYL